MVKMKCNVSVKTICGYLKYQYPLQWALKAPFSYAITGYGPKQPLSGRHRLQSHKSWADAHHQNCLSSNGITAKTSFKSYVNNISLCQACFLKLKFPCLKIF